jgi:hypothetical protein
MVVGPDNYPIISYYDSTNANLKVAKCGNAACSFDNILTTVDSTGNVGLYTSIVMGTDDLPVISYYNATSTDLKVVKCGNTACSSGNTGRNNSITMGADGYPVVTHHQATTLDLVLVKCGDASCSSGNSTSTLVGTGVGGYYISSGMGADGLPIISYHNIANTVLRMIKCGNASCSSGNTSTNIGSAGNTAFYNWVLTIFLSSRTMTVRTLTSRWSSVAMLAVLQATPLRRLKQRAIWEHIFLLR